jgi:hypothetical protein
MPAEGPVGTGDDEGTVCTEGEAGGGRGAVARVGGSTGLTGLDEKSFTGRLGAAAQLVVSGRD